MNILHKYMDVDWNHINKIKSDYFTHCYLAMKFNCMLLIAVITGTIHAFFPFLFAFTPYRLAKKVVNETERYFVHSDD